ncbi:E3 ubiquitin-protein ligase SP1 [Medicago truncatula]|nr:E3 ubiquitin-protein ligase SP1 [Medicago truncatula]AES61875.2 E3 ubiquitin ligase-like protein [Medicago truncatula]
MELALMGGVVFCSAAAVLYTCSKYNHRNAEILKSVTQVNKLMDIEQLLDGERSHLVVAISGCVVSETPIKCELTGLRGVVVEETVVQHYLRECDANKLIMKCNDNGSWLQNSPLTLYTRNEVPWYLDDGTGRVLVVGSETFEDSGWARACKTLNHLQGVKVGVSAPLSASVSVVGLKRIEWALPFGTSLTVVGEASRDGDGTVRIQRPPKGPFYVSRKTIDEQIADLTYFARRFKYASVGLTLFGAWLIAEFAIWCITKDGDAVSCEKVEIAPVDFSEGVGSQQVDSS